MGNIWWSKCKNRVSQAIFVRPFFCSKGTLWSNTQECKGGNRSPYLRQSKWKAPPHCTASNDARFLGTAGTTQATEATTTRNTTTTWTTSSTRRDVVSAPTEGTYWAPQWPLGDVLIVGYPYTGRGKILDKLTPEDHSGWGLEKATNFTREQRKK